MTSLRTIKAGAPTPERAAELAEAIKAICYDVGDGLSIATVIGCFEIVKIEILRDAE